jgi:hypothetical protein
MGTAPSSIPGTTAAHSVVTEARAVIAEHDPFEDPPMTEAERVVADGIWTRHEIRLLAEVIRRYMWDEGEI